MSNAKSEGVPGVGFLVMAFNDETAGDEVLKMMKDAEKTQRGHGEEGETADPVAK